ncbi:MAG TPA: hypothetical protein VGT60_13560 [Candidatus Limnocylindria bacterium]|nr:hypothetical protein [Candidatus Limnocylindria bacterium]
MDAHNALLVEDDPQLSVVVGTVLTPAGYRPIVIATHDLIPAALERWGPRCVIMDGELNTSGQNRSWDDAAAIRRDHPGIPVIMMTADSAALAEAQARQFRCRQRVRPATFHRLTGT